MTVTHWTQGRAWCRICSVLRAYVAHAGMDLEELRCATCGGPVDLRGDHAGEPHANAETDTICGSALTTGER